MSKICDLCGRGPKTAQSRSHSNIATKRWQMVNLQSRTIGGKRLKICTSCLKTTKKDEHNTCPRWFS